MAFPRTDPWRHQDSARRQLVAIISQIHQEGEGEPAPRTVSSDDDVFWRYMKVLDKSEVTAHDVVERTWKPRFWCQPIIQR